MLELEEDTHMKSFLCRPPASSWRCVAVLASRDNIRYGLRRRLSRTRLGDDCHSVSCTLAWQGTNLTEQLTRNLLHSNQHVSSAGGTATSETCDITSYILYCLQ